MRQYTRFGLFGIVNIQSRYSGLIEYYEDLKSKYLTMATVNQENNSKCLGYWKTGFNK